MMSEQISNERRQFAPDAVMGVAGTPARASRPMTPDSPASPGAPTKASGESGNFAPLADSYAIVENTPFSAYSVPSSAPSSAPSVGSPGAAVPSTEPAAPPANLADVSEGSLPIVKPLDTKQTPALRIARSRPQRPRLSQGPRPTRRTAPLALRLENPPPLLRLGRLVVGIVLLALAWVGVLAVVFITMALINGFPTQPHLSIRLALYLLGAVGTLWLAVMTLASIIVGAFSLTLALTTSGW